MTRLIAMLAALLLAGGLIAACGSDEKSDYAEEIEDALDPLAEDLQALGPELNNADDRQEIADRLTTSESNLEDAASEIEGLTVPEGVESVNEDLVSAINGFADELGKVRDAAEGGDAEALQPLLLGLPEVASDFEAQQTRIRQDAIDAGVPFEPAEGSSRTSDE